MKEKAQKRKRIHKIIVVALRETIRAHGPIYPISIGSAAKRISSTLFAKEKKDDSIYHNAK